MRAELRETPAFRDGQKDGKLILSGSNKEVGGNEERKSWKPIGGFHIMNPTATCKVGSIISPSEMGEIEASIE